MPSRRDLLRCARIAFLVSVGNFAGCARWSNLDTEIKKPSRDFVPQAPPEDSVAVEVILMRLGPQQMKELDSVWPHVNEQVLSIELRRRLDQNGVRVALVDKVVPFSLQTMIDSVEKRLNDDPLEQAGIGADVPSHSRLLQCRRGLRKEVTIRPGKTGSIVLLHNQSGVAKGRSYEEPGLLFDLRAFPKGDGSSSVSLTPEIQHGAYKQRYVGQEFALRREFKRDAESLTDLTIEQVIQPGQLLMLTGIVPGRGIGEHFFFTETATGDIEPLLMLIRVGATKLNSAFDTLTK